MEGATEHVSAAVSRGAVSEPSVPSPRSRRAGHGVRENAGRNSQARDGNPGQGRARPPSSVAFSRALVFRQRGGCELRRRAHGRALSQDQVRGPLRAPGVDDGRHPSVLPTLWRRRGTRHSRRPAELRRPLAVGGAVRYRRTGAPRGARPRAIRLHHVADSGRLSVKTVLFFRDFRRFSGGHLVVWHYFKHVTASTSYRPRVSLTRTSVTEHNPWASLPSEFVAGPGE